MMFSVIIPAHNAEKTIMRAVESVRMQTCMDWELIIILDSCTDGSEKAVENWHTIEIDCGSPGGARNAGLDAAKGEYVLFLDADDKFYTPYAFQILSEEIKKNPTDILHFGFIYGNTYAPIRGNGGNMWCNVWSRAWKRSVIGETRFNDKRFAEDFDFCNDVFPKAQSHAALEMPLIWYTPPKEGSLTWEAKNGNDNILSDNR